MPHRAWAGLTSFHTSSPPSSCRATFAFSWLALQAGQVVAAHEILQTRWSPSHLGYCPYRLIQKRTLKMNLELVCLLELGRLEEALVCLEEVVADQDMPEGAQGQRQRFPRLV